jgi:D-tyrosyl-tRNA(Tyr) deacylase
MRAVVQRVTSASVTVGGDKVSSIGRGLLVLLGVGLEDAEADARTLAEKIVNLRIFEDGAGKMNLSLLDVAGELLMVSQFTLFGDARKGRRPSFIDAMEPARASVLYEACCEACRRLGTRVSQGVFQADMQVSLVNDGPVTLLLDSKRVF